MIEFKELDSAQKIFYKELLSEYLDKTICKIEDIKFVESRHVLMRYMPEKSICAEIGVDQGDYSRSILKQASPKKLHLIDAWEKINNQSYSDFKKDVLELKSFEKAYEKFSKIKGFAKLSQYYKKRFFRLNLGKKMREQIENKQIEIHHGFASDISSLFSDNYFDWIFIDADHSYDSVKDDCLKYESKVKENGYIIAHDYIKPRFKSVIDAINDFCIEKEWRIRVVCIDYFSKNKSAVASVLLTKKNNNFSLDTK